MSSQFELPAGLTVEKFLTKISTKVDIQLASQQFSLKTYYDSFDWRLFEHNIVCEFDRSKAASILALSDFANHRVLASMALNEVPAFSKQFKPGKIRSILEPILEMRALLSICTLEYEHYQLNILNKHDKTVLRLLIEEYAHLNSRVTVQPIKGYDKAAERIIAILTTELGLISTEQPVLLAALKLQGRKPKEYSSKLHINLDPGMRADIASKYIYSHLLKVIKDNEQGVINDTDSEFLHDFRVAVRRTRSGLSQIKDVLPGAVSAYYSEFFSWLGQITSPGRDLDVYLLNFEHYKASLPASIREDLNPLYEFLLVKHKKAQQELAKRLRSAKYQTTLLEWESYLKEPVQNHPVETNAKLPIKQLADLRIWKIYSRVLQDGNAIETQTPAETLHSLRKTCKKLRYLMEFFQSFYPEQQLRHLIRSLKTLQEVLGDFQDYQVQEYNLRLFSEEMLANNAPVNTFLAMGVLIQDLDSRKCRTRKEFTATFSDFSDAENHALFKSLFNRH